MEIFGIAAFVLVAAMLTALLRQYLPAYGAVCLTLCAVLLLGRILQLALPLVEWFSAAAGYLDGDSFLVVLKAAGIALVAQNMQDVCKDAGLSTLAGKVELAGRCLILVCALPLFENIMGALIAFLQ